MKININFYIKFILIFLFFSTPAFLSVKTYGAISSKEKETFNISRALKPISDESWKSLSSSQESQSYEVGKGDTLFGISKRLFGEGKYWPKIWALNNGIITNPHLIRPGNLIAFMPGTGISLPSLGLKSSLTIAKNAPNGKRGVRSNEWMNLPRQRWENVPLRLPPTVDPNGFDASSVLKFGASKSFMLKAFVSTDKKDPIGTISSARKPSKSLTIGDVILIAPKQDLSVGETYTIVREPEKISTGIFGKSAYSYIILGTTRVFAVRDKYFIGVIETAQGVIERENSIIPLVPKTELPTPKPGMEAIKGEIVFNKELSLHAAAQHSTVFINRGQEEGIERGMVFRTYLYEDPTTKSNITKQDFINYADFLIIQVDKNFSTALCTKSLSTVKEGDSAVLLTSLDDFNSNFGIHLKSSEDLQVEEKQNELDGLDDGKELTPEEEKELKQLEEWKENPPEDSSSSTVVPDQELDEETPESAIGDELDIDQTSEEPSEEPSEKLSEAPDEASSPSTTDDEDPFNASEENTDEDLDLELE